MIHRSFLRSGATMGASLRAPSLYTPAFAASDLPDIQATLDRISVDTYVRKDYRKLYSMTSEPLWDPTKDWIRGGRRNSDHFLSLGD